MRHLLAWLSLVVFLILGLAARCWNQPQVFHDDGVYLVDADCYSRMTRVVRVMHEPWKSVRFHDFENAPDGTFPHTTAPMDLAIAALASLPGLALNGSPDLAGALISPLFGGVLILFLWWWSRRLTLPYPNALLLVVAVSPILVHGFLLGRPDHQSLILLLIGIALAAEIAIWQTRGRSWHILSAAAWALALWTSLFEPLILLLAVSACRLLVFGRGIWKKPDRTAAATFFGILFFALLFDGWRFHPFQTTGESFGRWAATIGELTSLSPLQLFPWTGWLLPIVPVLLLLRFVKERCRTSLALALLVLFTAGLTLWYARWGYFLALTFALCLPWALARIPAKPIVWIVFLISLWPMAAEWDRQLFPDSKTITARKETRDDALLLRETASFLRQSDPGIVLAPWWLSPALSYWSGLPCVAGSSHQSLPGIEDSAKFYLAPDLNAGVRDMLDRRAVQYVISYEPDRVLVNSAQITGTQPLPGTLGEQLYQPSPKIRGLRRIYQNPYFRVFAVQPEW